jgi:UDP-GlcNAc:undecaprenyl-phosphate GlcNAc-1-phosphate transferase
MIEFIFLFIINLFIIFFFFEPLVGILNCYDHPNNRRKIHKNKIAKVGGFLIIFNIFIFYTISFNNTLILKEEFFFILGCILFFLLGYFDDKLDINAYSKFFFQIIFILLLIIFNNDLSINNIYISFLDKKILLGEFSFFFTILCYLLFINAFNMLDGINLSAGIYTLFLLVFLYLHQNNTIFIVLMIAVLFFLIKNYHNKLFLGNNGSYLLGFILSFFFINLNTTKVISVEEIFLAMIIPGLDMLRLYVQRIYYKKNPFRADLNHLHHIILKKISYNRAIFYTICIINLPLFLSFLIKDLEKIYLIGFIAIFYYSLIYLLSNNKNATKRFRF